MAIIIRPMLATDFGKIIKLCEAVYRGAPPWAEAQLASQLRVFPQGQLVAVDGDEIVGYSASLIVNWDDYDFQDNWRDMTDGGYFTNHDPLNGRTLYGAEIMVHPDVQGKGIGKQIYEARNALMRQLNLLRIRAGARLRGYGNVSSILTPNEYVMKVVNEELSDDTLNFQLRHGFQVLAVTSGYLRHDPESLGYAAVIELVNPQVALPKDYEKQRNSPFYRRNLVD